LLFSYKIGCYSFRDHLLSRDNVFYYEKSHNRDKEKGRTEMPEKLKKYAHNFRLSVENMWDKYWTPTQSKYIFLQFTA
jgi:hypothetical protein